MYIIMGYIFRIGFWMGISGALGFWAEGMGV